MIKRTYFLCPGFMYGPESISLGYIIPFPSKPAVALNRDANFRPPPGFACETQVNVTITRHHPRNPKFGLMQNFLHVIGFRIVVDGTDTMEYKDRFDFDTIETIYYNPSAEDIRKAVESAGVKTFLASTLFRKPLYLVTGLKIARGVRSRRTSRENFRKHSKAGIAANRSVPNKGSGVELCASSSKSEGFTNHPDFIVAFQLRKLLVTRSIAHDKEYPSRAILDGEEDDEDESQFESQFNSEFNSEDDEYESEDEAFEIIDIPAGVNDLPDLVGEEIFYGPEDRTLILYSAGCYRGTPLF